MREILKEEVINIPENVTIIKKKNREFIVKGPKGELHKSFKHISFDAVFCKDKKTKRVNKLKIQLWFSKRKERAIVTTIASHLKNMINGVINGYKFIMKFAYAHFPIQSNLTNKFYFIIDKTVLISNKTIEIKNFLGERYVRKIDALEGCSFDRKEDQKDEITVKGIDLENVSLTCALITQSVQAKNKDLRQFLDGIYSSDKRLPLDE